MKFQFSLTKIFAISTFLSCVSASSSVDRDLQGGKVLVDFGETPCTATQLLASEEIPAIRGKTCTGTSIVKVIKRLHQNHPSCDWDFRYELGLLTGTLSRDKAEIFLQGLCDQAEQVALKAANPMAWESIDPYFTENFLDDYLNGTTFLNTGQGNFKNKKGIGDPRNNSNYPTDEESYLTGLSINAYYQDEVNGATKTILADIEQVDANSCSNQAIMCCFGRDRQYQDGSGTCTKKECGDADPGDNSNFCDDSLGNEAMHCHGLAWSDDTTDPSFQLRFNNFFYVLMHDHMYSRGYVEAAASGIPMCGCIEDMPAVSRADCSQVEMTNKYSFSYNEATGNIEITADPLNFKFDSCDGKDNQNNDLAAHILKLNDEEKLSDAVKDTIFATNLGTCD